MIRLKEIRLDNKMKRTELAELLGVVSKTVAAYEQGVHEPNIATLIKLSKIFNTTIDNLVGNDRDV